MSLVSLLTNLTSLYPSSEIEDCGIWEDVVLHEVCRAFCIREDDRRRCRAGEEVQREVCLSAGVHNEWIYWAAQAMWHHEGGRKPGLKGLWNSNTQRIRPEVHLSLLILQPIFFFFFDNDYDALKIWEFTLERWGDYKIQYCNKVATTKVKLDFVFAGKFCLSKLKHLHCNLSFYVLTGISYNCLCSVPSTLITAKFVLLCYDSIIKRNIFNVFEWKPCLFLLLHLTTLTKSIPNTSVLYNLYTWIKEHILVLTTAANKAHCIFL